MSLHNLAHHLQSAGRGEDKVLVHMTPGEVNGLQTLAKAHGGSLTVNPQTGLPEAGFLSSLLPMLAGGALTAMSGGAINPLTAGFLVGGGTAAATGSLKKGLMAGLGAYSGAGLSAGLSSMGTAAPTSTLAQAPVVTPEIAGAANTVTPAATTAAGAPTQIFSGGISRPPLALQGPGPGGYGAVQPGVFTPGSFGGTAIPAPTPGPNVISRVPSELYSDLPAKFTTNLPQANPPIDLQFYQTAGKVPDVARTVTVPSTGTYEPIGTKFDITKTAKAAVANTPALTPIDPANPYATAMDAGSYSTAEAPAQSAFDKVSAGFKKATTSGLQGLKDLQAASEAAAPYGMYAGLGSTAYSMYEEKREKAEEEARRRAAANQGMIRPYTFDYGATNISGEPYTGSAERTYFQPTYTAGTPYKAPGPEYAAKGGLMGLAVGGAVEEMAAQNAVGSNTGYPMANLQTPMYSNPSVQRPETGNVIASSADTGVNAYTGEARFAMGGPSTKQGYGGVGFGKTKMVAPETTGGYTYSYDPATMQFTQTGAPTPTSTANTGPFNLVGRALAAGINNPQPTTPNGQVSGGIATPMAAPTQPVNPAQSFIPNINIPAYQTPEEQLGLTDFYKNMNQTFGGYKGYAAGGGISHLGDYSDGGRLLKGPGDGVSDSIPASIGNRQPARLADGEFVVPARIVSEIGNGSTEAGARKLYAMMERVQKARRKTTGKNQVAANTKAERLLPA